MTQSRDRYILITFLRLISKFLPGNHPNTFVYLNFTAKLRKAIHMVVNSLYRMDHIYEVLRECKRSYVGYFTILEFGTAKGYSFTKILYATKYLQIDDRVVVHTFDSIEGLPATTDPAE
jgi:hypothetical protein